MATSSAVAHDDIVNETTLTHNQYVAILFIKLILNFFTHANFIKYPGCFGLIDWI